MWSSISFLCHDTLELWKGLIHKEIYWYTKKRVASHIQNHFSKSCINHKTNFLLCLHLIFLLASHVILRCWCEILFWTLTMYLTTLSVAKMLVGRDPVSRSRRVYGVSFMTWRNIVRGCMVFVSWLGGKKMLLDIFKFFQNGLSWCYQSI